MDFTVQAKVWILSSNKMAPSQNRPIKSLNKGPSGKRFVFKNFSQRLEEVDIDVFRSLAPVKFEPTQGSSFFQENLLQWRELNSAAEFISLYEELMPVVQTLPQVLLHKEMIVSKLLCRVHLQAKLSLEPILSLIAVLSRDLREEFMPFLHQLMETMENLLKSGGDRDPEILEQVFTAISYILKYMQKLLVKDIAYVMKITKQLRYYYREYVQEFMAEAVSFLLRNASVKQLIKGIRKIMGEVVMEPSEEKTTGCSALLWHILKGPSSKFHSRAEQALRLLLDRSTYSIATKKSHGDDAIVEVVMGTVQRLCKELKREELGLLWDCLLEEISFLLHDINVEGVDDAMNEPIMHRSMASETPLDTFIKNKDDMPSKHAITVIGERQRKEDFVQLSRVLSLLNVILEFQNGMKVNDYKPLFVLAEQLVKLLMSPFWTRIPWEDSMPSLVSETHRLLLGLVHNHARVGGASIGPLAISNVSSQWALLFQRKNGSLFTLIRGLIDEEVCVIYPFSPYIISALDNFIEESPGDVLALLTSYFEKLETNLQFFHNIGGNTSNICSFVLQIIDNATRKINSGKVDEGNLLPVNTLASQPALVWGALNCFPYIFSSEEKSSIVWDYVLAINEVLIAETDNIRDHSRKIWECMIGAALTSHLKLLKACIPKLSQHLNDYLSFARHFKLSSHVLCAVSDFLDTIFGKSTEVINFSNKEYHAELKIDKALDALMLFSHNLGVADKKLRLSTLRILSHYEPFPIPEAKSMERPEKKRKVEGGKTCDDVSNSYSKVIQQLFAIEASPLSVDTSRQITVIISKIQMDLCSGKIPDSYKTLLLHSLIGILHNRLQHLWDPAMECLASLLEEHGDLVWAAFVDHLEKSQLLLLALPGHGVNIESGGCVVSKDLDSQFGYFLNQDSESTTVGTVVSLLIRTAQKVPKLAEARSRQLIPLFLTFLGYSNQDRASVEIYDENRCKGKERKDILKEWLILIKEMRNPRSFFRGHFLKEILANRLLEQSDPDIQLKVLECLLNWKDGFLLSYEEHLKSLISLKSAREEVTTWSLSKESQQIEECHREELIPIIIRILISKVKKNKGTSSRKSAGALQRKAVLCFLAQLEVNELAPFFILLLKSLRNAFIDEHTSICGSKYSWEVAIEQGRTLDFINMISTEGVATLPYKKKSGFLHVMKDVLETFDEERMVPYLLPLLAFVLRILESCALSLEHQKDAIFNHNDTQGVESPADSEMPDVAMLEKVSGTGITGEQKQPCSVDSEMSEAINFLGVDYAVQKLENISASPMLAASGVQIRSVTMIHEGKYKKPPFFLGGMKDLRSFCLKVISIVLNKYDSIDYGTNFWNIFFTAIKPLVEKFRQESGSNETPSSLFTCFLEMSKSIKLASFLRREKSLVPNILSILSVKSVSEAMVSAILSFIENLLNLEDGNDEEQENILLQEILLPHLDILFTSMQNLVQLRRGNKRKSIAGPGKRELRIFKLLGKYATRSEVVNQFVDCLLPFLDVKKFRKNDHFMEILAVLKEVLPALGDRSVIKMLTVFSSLLTSSTLDIRVAICDILKGLSKVDPSLALPAKLVGDLNAISPSTVGEYDYDKRLAAYEKISPQLFSNIGESHTLLILSHCVYDVSSEDLSLRHSASSCLLSFIQFSASVLESEEAMQQEDIQDDLKSKKPNHINMVERGLLDSCINYGCGNWSKVSVKHAIYKFFLAHVKKGITSSETSVQREWVALLRSMVLSLSGIATLNEIKPLSSTDVEVDFFNNILHIQKHRRSRAMTRFRNILDAGNLSEGNLMQIFVPLFFSLLFEAKGDREGNVVNSCLETLACIAGHTRWDSYFSLLMRAFRLMASKEENSNILVRLICSILDKFHFIDRMSSTAEPEKRDHQTEIGETALDNPDMELRRNGDNKNIISPEIQERLQKCVLPEINKMMISHSNVVNISVSRAALKLLKLMPLETMELELPHIIQRIANLLKSRPHSVRDDARTALAACAKELGPQYLQFIVKTLQTTLTRGYELHVLGYTVNFILSKVSSSLDIGDIDYCVQQLLEVAENDIMGEVAEEKEVEKIAFKMKETRSSKSFESLQLIARSITFSTHASTLLVPVRHNLHRTLAPKEKVKIESMLRYLATGLQANASLSQTDLFVFVYGLIEDGMEEENVGRKTDLFSKSGIASSRSSASYKNSMEGPADDKLDAPNRYLITVFALRLLENHLKKLKVDTGDQYLIAMLDPFIELLGHCLKSKYEGVISHSVKCLACLLRLPLPSIDIHSNNITSSVFNMVLKSGKSDSPLMQSSVNLLVMLLRHANTTISNDQLKMLLQCPLFIDLESSSTTIALSLLKAIVKRKLLVPDLYDLVTRVARLMVTSQALPIRQQCGQVLLQFLLDYPLGAKRLQQHLDFLVANLSYEHTSGREAVLEMLHVIILKFPSTVVDEQAETFFLPLVTRLVNDSDNQVRAMVGTVLKVLIGRVSQRPLQRMLVFSLSWYTDEKQQLWRPAAQVLGLLIEVMKKSFQAHIEDVRPRAVHILKCAITANGDGKPVAGEEDMLAFWQEAYYSLIMLEKLLLQFPEVSFHKDIEEIWDLICSLLVHPHMWLRNICGRLIDTYFTASASEINSGNWTNISSGKTAMLLQPSRLILLAASFCHQLDTDLLDEGMSDLVVKNLIYVTCALYSFVKSRQETDLSDFFFTLDTSNQSLILKAFSLLGSKACREVCAYLVSRQCVDVSNFEVNEDVNQDLKTSLLEPIFKKLGKVALKVRGVQTKSIFEWYKAISLQMGHEGVQSHGATILLPLYKITEGFAGKVISGDLKLLADDVLCHMKDIMGVESFVQAYNLVRQKVKATRDKRKKIEKIAAIVNPMRHAQKKMKLTGKRQAQKKKKILKNKIRRG